ncbi:MAG: DNA internalization-related competence protein ComEC/Rec2 [Gammaproteobacteria bacterium]
MRVYLVAFCLGIWFLQQQPELPAARWLWVLPLLALALRVPPLSFGVAEVLRRVAVAVLCAALGFAWAAWRAELRLAERLPDAWQGRDIELVGVVSELPHIHAGGVRFVLDVEAVLTPGAPALGRVQLARYAARNAAPPEPVRAGERWRLTARLKIPYGTHNPHGFDLEAWALEQGISASGSVRERVPPVRLDARAATPGAWIAAMRAAVRDRIFATLGEAPYAGVIAALTIGDQRSIPYEQWRAFTRTGVNHLLSISGLHVTMIAALAGWAVAFGWRRWPRAVARLPARQAGLAAAVLVAFGYALLAGFQVPAQRTLFMLAVLALAFWGRREPRPFTALLVALAVVLTLDPWAVLSAGFWLSFGAMAAIMWVTFGRVALPDKLRGWVTVQAAVTVALAPALLLLFQQVSLVSPFANAVAIPVVSWLVTPLALLGTLVPPLWHASAWLMEWLGVMLVWMAELPWAVATRPAPGLIAVVLAVLGTLWLLLPRGFPARALGLALWLPILLPPAEKLAPGAFRVEVIDVGQGTSILVRTARHALLYDTGASFGDSDAGERIVVPYLRASGIGKLDGVIVSHNDNDHSGGLPSVVRDIPTGWMLNGQSPTRSLPSGAPPPRRCVRGQSWVWDSVPFVILNPPATASASYNRSDNDFSCVLSVGAGARRFLVTGDAGRRGELELLESGIDLTATALVAGHHGSRSSSMEAFVEKVAPDHVVFTSGYRNRYHHPHRTIVERFRARGANILRSDRDGLIRFEFGEAGVTAAEYRNPRRYWHLVQP